MANMKSMRTAECVTPKHPDKMADQISDAILDLCLQYDDSSRVAIEVLGGHGEVYICGELTTGALIPDKAIAKIVERIVGYEPKKLIINIVKQSPEITQGVDTGGAGDQGIMKGYACDDNEEMIPQEMYLARSLCKFLFEKYPYDGKTQITLADGKIETLVASFQNVPKKELEASVLEWLTNESPTGHTQPFNLHCNPAGDWSQGGFDADTGLTGRKLMVDNYGPQLSIGGGAFSGKDATKVDRSAAYMARKIAVDLLKKHDALEQASGIWQIISSNSACYK
jgi:S-adenosylmethionine synthetase